MESHTLGALEHPVMCCLMMRLSSETYGLALRQTSQCVFTQTKMLEMSLGDILIWDNHHIWCLLLTKTSLGCIWLCLYWKIDPSQNQSLMDDHPMSFQMYWEVSMKNSQVLSENSQGNSSLMFEAQRDDLYALMFGKTCFEFQLCHSRTLGKLFVSFALQFPYIHTEVMLLSS